MGKKKVAISLTVVLSGVKVASYEFILLISLVETNISSLLNGLGYFVVLA